MIVGGIESSAVLFWGITGLAKANTSGGGLCKGILLWIGCIWLLCMTEWCMMASTSIVSLRFWMQAGLYWSLPLGASVPSLLKYWGNGAQGSSLIGLGVDRWLPDPEWSICLKEKRNIISFHFLRIYNIYLKKYYILRFIDLTLFWQKISYEGMRSSFLPKMLTKN